MIVSICSHKGGVGKSTTAIHLAGALQETGATLVVDGDLNRQCMAWAEPGLLPFAVVSESDAGRERQKYKHVVIDTPARPGAADLSVLVRNSDLVILPTAPAALSLSAMLRTVADLGPSAKGKLRVLLTIVPPRPSRAAEDAREGLAGAGLRVFCGQIRRLSCFERAAENGQLVRDVVDPRAALGWADYMGVAREILA